MENILFYFVVALGISTILNIFLKNIGISPIIGYIFTGTIISYLFHLKDAAHSSELEHIAEFGIVFLMFTIGLEISLRRMKSMRYLIFVNGLGQVVLTTIALYAILHYIVGLSNQSSLMVAMAFSLSSTAVVLTYLKETKEIYSDYGQKATGILIFQDIAVIPILILIGFLTSDSSKDLNVYDIALQTGMSALIVLVFMFSIGKYFFSWLLHFSASSETDVLFMTSVLFIVTSASYLAHSFGFTYSLGAFIAGMIIAETKYLHKVEADIAPFKDILLGVFFLVVGMKIDIGVFFDNVLLIIGSFLGISILKAIIIFLLLRPTSLPKTAFKTALSLSQIGEFSFVIFALASSGGLLDKELVSLMVMIVIFSMIVTPFFISKLQTISDKFIKCKSELPEAINIDERRDHIIICGFDMVGKNIALHFEEYGINFLVIDNNPIQLKEALDMGYEAYLGDMSKKNILEALHVENAAIIIITLNNPDKKVIICEEILKITKNANIVVNISSPFEREKLKELNIPVIVDEKVEVARVIVERMMSCQLTI